MTAAWLRSKNFDLTFIVGIALLAGAMSGVTVFWPALFLPMLAVHSALFGYEHLWATYSKLLLHPQDRARHWGLIFVGAPLVLLCLYAIGRAYGLTGLYVIYFFGQFHHTVRQSWGLAQKYRWQAGGLPWDPERLSELTIWSVPVWGFLYRCSQQPEEFLFQDFWLPPVPYAAVKIAAAASAALWLYWLVTRIAAYRRSELALGHTLYMLSHVAIYLAGYILIDELCSGWLLVNVWHNVQYMVYVWFYNRNRFAKGIDPQSRALSWISQAGASRAAFYVLASVALALPIYYGLPYFGGKLDEFVKNTAVPTAMIVGLSLTFHHYLVDSVIWQRTNQDIRKNMQHAGASLSIR